MAVRCPDREFVDPYGGVVDLAHRLLRTPGTPEDSFSDDPLRMMRAARFAAQLGFTVDPTVVAAMTAMAERIEIVSAERVRDELVKLAAGAVPAARADPARRDRARRARAARAARARARARRAPPAQGRLRAHPDGARAVDRPGGPAARRRSRLRLPVRRADARRRQAAHPPVRRRRHGDLPPPRRGRRQAHPQADEGAAVLQRRRSTRSAKLVELHLRFHGYGDGRVDRLGRTSLRARRRRPARAAARADPGRLHDPQPSARPTGCAAPTTTSRPGSRGCRRRRSSTSIRPDLDGNQIMEILGIAARPRGREAYRFLLDLRLDNGPMTEDDARAALLAWWALGLVPCVNHGGAARRDSRQGSIPAGLASGACRSSWHGGVRGRQDDRGQRAGGGRSAGRTPRATRSTPRPTSRRWRPASR